MGYAASVTGGKGQRRRLRRRCLPVLLAFSFLLGALPPLLAQAPPGGPPAPVYQGMSPAGTPPSAPTSAMSSPGTADGQSYSVDFKDGVLFKTNDGMFSLRINNLLQVDYRDFSHTAQGVHTTTSLQDNFTLARWWMYVTGNAT